MRLVSESLSSIRAHLHPIDISITAHNGVLRGLYATLGVPPRSLDVGEMNVLVVRVKKTEI
jgi:hypothetical protein